MRTVFFTTHFPPLKNPRSFRLGKMINNYNEDDFLVITSKVNIKTDSIKNVIRCGLKMNIDYSFRNALKKNQFLQFIKKCIWPDDKILHQCFYLLNYLFKYRNKKDKIYTVSNPFSGHIIGLLLKKYWNHSWTADIGDSFYDNGHKSILSKSLEQSILKNADQIIVNSESLKTHYILNYTVEKEKISIIPNELPWDLSDITHSASEFIRLSYIGNTYSPTREAIKELDILIQLAKNYSKLNIKIQLFGMQFYKVEELAMKYPNLIHLNYCHNETDIRKAYENTDILINFANKTNPGLPSKLQEYKQCSLPVIHFMHTENDPGLEYLKNLSTSLLSVQLSTYNLKILYDFIVKNGH